MEFHEKLQELRKSRELTQEELAEELYVSRTAISKWESGRGFVRVKGGSHNPVVNNTDGCVLGYKYFNFSKTKGDKDLRLFIDLVPLGQKGYIDIFVGNPQKDGQKVGRIKISKKLSSSACKSTCKNADGITGKGTRKIDGKYADRSTCDNDGEITGRSTCENDGGITSKSACDNNGGITGKGARKIDGKYADRSTCKNAGGISSRSTGENAGGITGKGTCENSGSGKMVRLSTRVPKIARLSGKHALFLEFHLDATSSSPTSTSTSARTSSNAPAPTNSITPTESTSSTELSSPALAPEKSPTPAPSLCELHYIGFE